ncbi:hypothetical protein EVAR_53583_1 [Eumeta japonica]|uniref:Uncharacterized protein n=1 Tax=Eumeta variegata TaxID=151549 RepID=A0A4C1YKZ8_EUMVA|nr:hypothetical protein EVAR_53583_1 [Eumeta japonica]
MEIYEVAAGRPRPGAAGGGSIYTSSLLSAYLRSTCCNHKGNLQAHVFCGDLAQNRPGEVCAHRASPRAIRSYYSLFEADRIAELFDEKWKFLSSREKVRSVVQNAVTTSAKMAASGPDPRDRPGRAGDPSPLI